MEEEGGGQYFAKIDMKGEGEENILLKQIRRDRGRTIFS